MTALGHLDLPDGGVVAGFAQFGADWLYILVPGVVFLVIAAALVRRSDLPRRGNPAATVVGRFADGSARLLGLPAWCAGPLLLAAAALVYAVVGFFWDVAWHIDIGRDEFLLSPPHTALLLGLAGIGVAGALAVWTASRSGEDVGWRIHRRRVPFGAAAMVASGVAATLGFAVDELWHWAYGLDVSMWSPPHLVMISSAAFAPLSMWLLYAESGPSAGRSWVRRLVPGVLAGWVLVALSAWQLEFDLGVPQWQQLYQPVLVALAAAFALVAARTALGRGGALIALGHYLVIRVALLGMTAQVWGLTEPRFPLYLAAAVAVELVFALTERRSRVRTGLLAGAAVGTVGLAGAWAWSQVWFWTPWGAALLPGIGVATAAAVAAALLGAGYGAAVSHRPADLRPAAVVVGLAGVVVALALPGPRNAPELTAEVRTVPAADGWVHVEVDLEGPDVAAHADRWEVMSWQGHGSQLARLEAVAPGSYVSDRPVPAHGSWKSIVRYARNDRLGAIAVYMPADPEIGASGVPVLPVRREALVPDAELLLREAHDGPRWPGLVAYAWVFSAIGVILGLTLAATVALERRRRAVGWTRGAGTLHGRRVLLSGAAGGIGRAARSALEAQGARVVGLDLVSDRPDTIAVDVTDQGAAQAAVAEAVARLGGLDTVIANAGVGLADDSTAPPDDAARRVVEVNLWGAWHTIAAALPHLPRGGAVIGVTSGLASATVPLSAAYTASKRGLAGYLDVLRVEAGDRFAVVEVQPGYIRTGIHDAPAATGATLDGIARCEPVEHAAAAIVAACERPRRRVATSLRTAAELAAARHVPALADRVIRARWRRQARSSVAPQSRPGGSTQATRSGGF